jgi:glycosyltransferase involved in cell wall biosynthesis
MKKVLFIHDGPRWKDSNGIQYGTSTDEEMYKRYLYLGDKVEFAMRVFETDNVSNLFNLNNFGLYINEIVPFNRPHLLKNYFTSKKEIMLQVEYADILVVRLPSTIGSVAVSHARKINKPYLVEVVGCPWDTLRNHGFLGKLYSPFSRNKLKNHVLESPYVLYVTKFFLQTRYPSRFKSIGISDVILKDLPKENRKFLNYENFSMYKKITFTTLGGVNLTYKGHKHVLEAMVSLVKDGYNIHYNIVGGGDNTKLYNLAKGLSLDDRVVFPGKISHGEVFNLLENTDLYLQPSDAEGLPRALIEAMSRGCAAIGSNVAGIPELLDESVIFKSKDVKDLTNKIKYILNKDILLTQSKKNFKLAKEYSFENLEKRRNVFFDKFLKSINDE